MKKSNAAAVLTLTVEYNLNGEKKEYLAGPLRNIAASAAGNGMMSGDSAAEVETWDLGVKWI